MEGHHRLATAEWMNPEAVAANYEYKSGDFFLGRSPLDGTPLGYNDDRHICLVAGTRSGKGATAIVNNLCEWPGSIVVNDPKGENATVTAARRGEGSGYCEGMGQAVHVIDPFRESSVEEKYLSRFNPLDALDPNDPNSLDEAGLLADAMVKDSEQGGDDGFFQIEARKIIKALILHVLTAPDFEGRRNLLMVRELITCGDLEGVELTKEMGNEEPIEPHEFLWIGVAQNQAFEGAIARLGRSQLDVVRTAPKQYAGSRANAEQNTEFLDSPAMRHCVSASDFKISDLKTDPKGVSIFLCVPSRMMTQHFRWLRMMVTLIVSEMEATRGKPACGHRVLLALDEFAGLERMKVLETAVAQLAGFGVKLMFVVQDFNQLKKIYKEGWETFLSNSGLKVFFGLDDLTTCEYVSKLLGETEVPVETENWNESDTETHSFTDSTGQTRTESRSTNTSDTTSSSHTKGRNENVNYGQSTNRSFGENESTGENFSRSYGTNWSDSVTRNKGGGRSENQSWKAHKLLFRNTDRYTHWLRENETAGRGDNSNWGKGKTRSRGGSENMSQGQSTQRGTSWNTGESSNYGFAYGTSESDTSGQSRTEGNSETSSVSENESHSTTEGSSKTTGKGGSVTLQKRPLATVDELRFMFDRIEEGGYGWCLVLTGGKRGIIASRCRYFEDRFFAFHYDPHPDHAEPPTLIGSETITLPDTLHARIIDSGQIAWTISRGDKVEYGQSIATVSLPAPAGDEQLIFKRLYPQFPLNTRLNLHIQSTIPGEVDAMGAIRISDVMIRCAGQLASFKVNRRRLVELDDTPIVQSLQEYSEFLDILPTELEKLAEERRQEAARQESERLAKERKEAERRAEAERLAKEKREAEEQKLERLAAEREKEEAARKRREYIEFIRQPEILGHPWLVGFAVGIVLCILGVMLDIHTGLWLAATVVPVVGMVITAHWWEPVRKAVWHSREFERKFGESGLEEVRKKFFDRNEEELMSFFSAIILLIMAGPTLLEWYQDGYFWPGFKSIGIGLIKCWVLLFAFMSVAWVVRWAQWYLGAGEKHLKTAEEKRNASR